MGLKIILFASLMFVGLSTQSHSRVGETKNECIKRYGDADIDEDSGYYFFYKGGYRIIIWFSNDKAVTLNFSKMTNKIFGEKMSENEIEILLDKNSHGRSWIKRKRPTSLFFHTKDLKFMASYDQLNETLTIGCGDYMSEQNAANEASEKEKLDDF